MTELDRSIYEWQLDLPGFGEAGQERLRNATAGSVAAVLAVVRLFQWLLPGLITEIIVYWPSGRGAAESVAHTPADYPIISVTAWRPDSGAIRLAATGIGPRPIHLTTAEAALTGGLDDEAIAAAARAASTATHHPGDFRGDAAYRAEMAAVLTRRALAAL